MCSYEKTTVYPELKLEVFGLENAENLHYIFLSPKRENPRFHQMLIIYLREKGKNQVISAVNEISKYDFVKRVRPVYIYDIKYD